MPKNLSFVASTAIYLRTSHPKLFVEQTIGDIAPFVVALLGLLSRSARIQWAVGVLILVISVVWAITFSSSF